MKKILARSWVRGGIAGLVCGLILVGAGSFGLAERAGAGEVVLAFASVPVWAMMHMPFEISEFIMTLVLLLYWSLIGMFIGSMAGRGKVGTIAVACLFVVLFMGHLRAKAAIEKDIETAIEAFIDSLQGE